MSAALTVHRSNVSNVKGFRKQRTHDYIYDPLHTTSGEADHIRDRLRARASGHRLKKVTEYGCMFSSLPHHPNYSLRLDPHDPVPAFMDQRWRGRLQQRQVALRQLAGPSFQRLQRHTTEKCKVSGTDRWKYFRRPLIPFSSQIPADVVFALPKPPLSDVAERPQTPFQLSRGVQTDYRESEAQTEPYSPEYVLQGGSVPELLTLSTLTWGHGLPVGLAEVEMIERARARRAWELSLPPLNDISQLQKRRRMMEEMERKEWALREEEIEKLQEARLEHLTRLLQQREQRQEEATLKSLDAFFSQHQGETDARVRKIRSAYAASVRKLMTKRKNLEGKPRKHDIIRDHADYGSQIYAPMSRFGRIHEQGSERYVVKSRFLDTYEGLLELEAGLHVSATKPRIIAPKPRTTEGFVKRSTRQDMELRKIYQEVKEVKVKKTPKPLKFLQRTEKLVSRPPTPTVDILPEGEEKRELAVIMLQKLLRGRSVQNMMFEGKNKRAELIAELRSSHALQREQQAERQAERQVTLSLQQQREVHQGVVQAAEGLQAGLAGDVLARMLDFLSKELLRVQEERRIHALGLLAERDRRRREAEESGRRQLEEQHRREEDERFRQVVQVHQDTVDLYLEDIILGSIENTAEEQAREEIHKMAEEVNNIAYSLERTRTKLQSEEIVAEMVYSFLIPEVQKITLRERVRQSQRRHLQAAHLIVHGEAKNFCSRQAALTPGCAPSPSSEATSSPGRAPSPLSEATSPPGQAPSPLSEATSPPGQAPSPSSEAAFQVLHDIPAHLDGSESGVHHGSSKSPQTGC